LNNPDDELTCTSVFWDGCISTHADPTSTGQRMPRVLTEL